MTVLRFPKPNGSKPVKTRRCYGYRGECLACGAFSIVLGHKLNLAAQSLKCPRCGTVFDRIGFGYEGQTSERVPRYDLHAPKKGW